MKVRTHAALSAKGPLEPLDYDPGLLAPQQVDVRVTHCGICHTDSAMVDSVTAGEPEASAGPAREPGSPGPPTAPSLLPEDGRR
jgi:D-arabinose 1-dehydrogenase-like Zn-dependent alcohol dehydrogenase